MAENKPGLDFFAKYIPEAVGYFQGRRAIKDEVDRLRKQDPLRQERIQMDPSLQQAFRDANTRMDVDQQQNIERQVQEAIRRNPRNIAKAIEAGQSASSKTRAADNLRRLEGLKSAGTLGQRLNQLNSTIDLGNETRERQQEDRIALTEAQKRRLNTMGITSLSSALGEGMDAFGKSDKEVLLGPEGREERGVARAIASAGGRTSDLLEFLGQGTTSSEPPEVSLDGITIDPNVEPARNIPGQGGINVVTAPEDRVMSGSDAESAEPVPDLPSSFQDDALEYRLARAGSRAREGQRRYGIEPLTPINYLNNPDQLAFDEFLTERAERNQARKEPVPDLPSSFQDDALEYRLDRAMRENYKDFEEELERESQNDTLSKEDFPRYRTVDGRPSIWPSIFFDPQLNMFSKDYDPILRYMYDGRVREDNPYLNREGGAVVTPDGYDHDGVDINMTDAENGKFLGSVESAEMIVNAEDTSEGLRLAKKNPNNPLSKWYLSLTKKFQKEAKEREIQNKQ